MIRRTAQFGLLLIAFALCAIAVQGCANCRLPQIDPSGERLFVDPATASRPNFREVPPANGKPRRTELILTPRETVAPVGSEVILLAGVRGPDEYLRTNERVEWMIDSGSVGQFVDLNKGSWTDPFVGDFVKAQKIDNTYVVNTTSRQFLELTRGTPEKKEHVQVLKGQAWVTLTSAREGTSDVTVYCPAVSPWEARTELCQVHWVDASWTFPSVAIAQAGGRQRLTTTVSRQTDNTPRCGWIVRYKIEGGPPAGFAPDGSQMVEVTTDSQGKAEVDLFQSQPQPGTSKVSIQVIRPEGLGCPNRRVVMAQSCLAQTWSAPDLAVQVLGASVGSVGTNLGFRVEVRNPGDMAVEGVALSIPVPPGLTPVSATPSSETTGSTLRWTLPRLAAGEVRSIAVDLRPERAGQFELCAEATAASGLSARGCANLAVETADLVVEVTGPTEAAKGDSVTHRILVSNRSRVPATALVITDTRDAGLGHDVSTPQIRKSLGNLGAMQSQEVLITFRALELGQQCHTVQVTGAGGLNARRRVCVQVRQPAPSAPVPSPAQPSSPWNEPSPLPGDSQQPPAATQETPPSAPQIPYTEPPQAPASAPEFAIQAYFANLDSEKIRSASVGDEVLLFLEVISSDNQDLSGLAVSVEIDSSFEATLASGGNKREGSRITWRDQQVSAGALGRFAVKCKCLEAVPSAGFRGTISDSTGQQKSVDAYLSVVASTAPAPGETSQEPDTTSNLKLTLSTASNPARQGDTFIYQVFVTNESYTEDRNIDVAVAFPPGLTPYLWRTMPSPKGIANNTVEFAPIASLPGREQLKYSIRVKADKVGTQYEISAAVRSDNCPNGEFANGFLDVTQP